MPVRVGVIGVGQFGQNHARVVKQSPRAVLAGVVDRDPARAAGNRRGSRVRGGHQLP